MSLLSPPSDLPAHLRPAWPWIWLQHLVLLAWIRLTYGRGFLYCWAITDTGRVELLWIDTDSRKPAIVRAHRPPSRAAIAGLLTSRHSPQRNPVHMTGAFTGVASAGANVRPSAAYSP